jgi:Fe-S-cluster containining protein
VAPPRNNLISNDPQDLARAVEQCSKDSSLMQAILDVYENVSRAAQDEQTLCLGGGACCRFDLFDHRLYVTLGELAMLVQTDPPEPARIEQNRCPYQQGPRCMARENRPLGCRVFFCRQGPGADHTAIYEPAHDEICRLHDAHDIPYAYVELIFALKILRQFCR